jgi:hypothetical protein
MFKPWRTIPLGGMVALTIPPMGIGSHAFLRTHCNSNEFLEIHWIRSPWIPWIPFRRIP